MHILIIPSWYENKKKPTLGSFFKEQAIALAAKGHKVGMIYSEPVSLKNVISYFDKTIDSHEGLTINRSKYLSLPFSYEVNFRNHVKNYKKLYAQYISENGQPQLIHAHSFMYGPGGAAGIAAYEIALEYNVKYVVTEHASALKLDTIGPRELNKIKIAASGAEKLFAVSPPLAQLMNDKLQLRGIPTVIGNVIDTHLFTPSTSKENKYTFITIAHLRPVKEITKILHAFSLTQKKVKSIALIIIGDGPQRKVLQELTKTLNLSNVTFTGELPRQGVAAQLRKANCYINWSRYETFSVATHEAISCGLRIISTPCEGPEDSIRFCSEFICDSNTPMSLSEKMLQLLNAPTNLRISPQQKHEFIEHNFGKNAISTQLIAEYESIVQ